MNVLIVILLLVIIGLLLHINSKLPSNRSKDNVAEAMERDRKAREERMARKKGTLD
ncbi:hypothetical protein ACK8P5_02995 [Paenibacillus sp. EC2-1]|uniref:hypothetical protein n=1 Tax=Paenibacillus sp. EC2-1 TaxID=3388665 RepID=UPI003BEF38DD